MPKPKVANIPPDKTRREALLDEAAIELNSQGVSQNTHGGSQTSLTRIAMRLGVTRAALYYYVEDQQDLVFQCYRHSCEVIARRIVKAKKASETAVEFLDAFVDGMLSPGEPEIAAISELAYLSEDKQEMIAGLWDGLVAQLARIIDSGIKTGEFRQCGSAHVARAILAIAAWPLLLKRFDPRYEESTDRTYAEAIKAFIKRGMAANRTRLPELDQIIFQSTTAISTNFFASDDIANAKREALLAAGSRILNRKGVNATSIDEIALTLGVSKAVIYHNIGDKQTFVLECYRRSNRIFFEIAEQVQRASSSRLNAAASAIQELCRLHFQPTSPLLLPIVGFAAVPSKVADELREQQARLQALWVTIIRDGHADKSIGKMNAELALALTPALLHWVSQWHGEASNTEVEEIAAETANLWAVGILALKSKN